MTIDVEKYMHYLDEFDMTRGQKVNWVYALYGFVQMFVDAAWDFDPNNSTHVSIRKCTEDLKDKPLSPELEQILGELQKDAGS